MTISNEALASEVVTTNLTIEEIASRYGLDDLDILNEDLACEGLSQCVECGVWGKDWVKDVDDDWCCAKCQRDDGEGYED
jgi:hypothetical protein